MSARKKKSIHQAKAKTKAQKARAKANVIAAIRRRIEVSEALFRIGRW